MKLSKINLSVTYFYTQGKSASSGQKEKKQFKGTSDTGLTDYKKTTQTVIF